MHFKGWGAIGEPMQSRLIALMDLRHCCRTFRLRIAGGMQTYKVLHASPGCLPGSDSLWAIVDVVGPHLKNMINSRPQLFLLSRARVHCVPWR